MLRHAEDIQTIHALTRGDLKRLRNADRVSFSRTPNHSHITTSKEKTTTKGTETEWEHEIPAHSTIKACTGTYKEPEGVKPLTEVASCHHLVWYANNISEPLRTIISLLKVGDRLEMEWTRDAMTNKYMEKAQLHGDRLQLVVHRGDKKLLFLIYVQCCEDNTARLIRRGPWNNE